MVTTAKLLTYEEWLKLPEAEGVEESCQRRDPKDTTIQVESHPRSEELAAQLRALWSAETTYVVTSVFGLSVRREPVTTRVPDLAVFIKNRIIE